MTATVVLVSPSLAVAQTSFPALSLTPPARLVSVRPPQAASSDGLPKTGADLLPEALIGATILAAGAGLRAVAANPKSG